MSDHTPALYSFEASRLVPTDYTRGPWDPGLQHGGPVGGALGLLVSDAIAAVDASHPSLPSDPSHPSTTGPPMTMTRLTIELLRPVPVAPLETATSIARRGRRAAVARAELRLDGRIVAQASSQWVRPVPIGQPPDPAATVGEGPPPLPADPIDPAAGGFDYPRPGFNCDAFELRSVVGDTETTGPGTMWARMKVRLVDDRPVEPIHLLATAADLANAIGWEPSVRGEPMINPDLTLQIFRPPIDEWICLESRARIGFDGVGMMETVLWDAEGRIGRVLSTMMENTGASVAGVTMADLPTPTDSQ